MALLQYFRSVPGEHLPLQGQSLVSAKGLIFCETTVARKFNPRIITVIQPKRPPRKFSPAKNTRYTVASLRYSKYRTTFGKWQRRGFLERKYDSYLYLQNYFPPDCAVASFFPVHLECVSVVISSHPRHTRASL